MAKIKIRKSTKPFEQTVSYIHAQLTLLTTIKNNPTKEDLETRRKAIQQIMREIQRQDPSVGLTDEMIDNYQLEDEFEHI